MELFLYLAVAFFVGGFIANNTSTKKKNKELEKLEEQHNEQLQQKNKELKELQEWKRDRELKEGKNSELISKIQRQEKELSENIEKNQQAISNLKTNDNYKKAIQKVEDLSNRLRKSIAQIENDFSKRIASFAEAGDEPKGLNAINKKKVELSKTGVLPNPYMKNPYKKDEE